MTTHRNTHAAHATALALALALWTTGCFHAQSLTLESVHMNAGRVVDVAYTAPEDVSPGVRTLVTGDGHVRREGPPAPGGTG